MLFLSSAFKWPALAVKEVVKYVSGVCTVFILYETFIHNYSKIFNVCQTTVIHTQDYQGKKSKAETIG